jgi:hypothetical protein
MKIKKRKALALSLTASAVLLGGYLSYENMSSKDNGIQENSKVVTANTNVEKSKVKYNVYAELEVFPFEETVARSDLIAKVKIGEIQKEIDEPSPKTIFYAEIVDKYKGEYDKEDIYIAQQGNSTHIFNGNELFKKDKEYLLFLKKSPSLGENVYWILGEETSIYEDLGNNKLKRWANDNLSNYSDVELKDLTIAENKKIEEYNQKALKEKDTPLKKTVQIIDEIKFKKKIETVKNK